MSTAAAIVRELSAAFPAIRPARFVPMVNSAQGDEPLRVQAAFADKADWTALSPDWLDAVPDGLASALSFLSDAAIRFYIPAYLAADLAGALHRIDPAFALVHGFDDLSRDQRVWPRRAVTWTDLARARWDPLPQNQAIVIAQYLAWRVARQGPEAAEDVAQALATYWRPRADRLAHSARR